MAQYVLATITYFIKNRVVCLPDIIKFKLTDTED